MNDRVSLYSTSLYAVAVENGCGREVFEGLNIVAELLKEHGEYIKLINSAQIPFEEREKLLDEAFGISVHPFVLNFMKILCRKRLFKIVLSVALEYEKLYFKDNNIERAKITTAIELNDEKKAQITEKLAKATKKEIIPEFFVDETILGGMVVETESAGIDASLDGRLESIKRYISKI